MAKRCSTLLIVLVFALLIAGFLTLQLGNWRQLLYRPGSEYSDLTITFWPNLVYIQQSVAEHQQWPLWRTSIFSGSPFDSDPQSGLWYPPNLIFLLTPVALGINLLVWAHLAVAALGAWLWARSEGLSWQAGALNALGCAFMPRLYAHLGFGHMGLFYGASYVPWALWASQGVGCGEKRKIPFLGLVLGLQLLANPQVFYYTLLLSWVYVFYTAWLTNRSAVKMPALQAAAALSLATFLGGMVSAVQLLPMLRFAPLSGRAAMGVTDSAISSLPLRYLWGVLVADQRGYMEYLTYFGIVALILAMFTLPGKRYSFFWICLAAAGIYAFGTQTPLYGWLYRVVPVLAWLRSPARIFLVVTPLIYLLAGAGFDDILRSAQGSRSRLPTMVTFALGAFALALTIGFTALYGRPPANLVAFGVLTPLTVAVTMYAFLRSLSKNVAFSLLAALMFIDFILVDATFIEGRSEMQLLNETPLVSYLSRKRAEAEFRIYSPSYSLPRYLGAWYDLETADGVDPLYLADYDQFMQAAAGVKRSHYEVTIPPMEGELPPNVNRGAMPNPILLGRLNVRYVAAEYPLQVVGLALVNVFGSTYLYENADDLGRVYFSTQVETVESLQAALTALEGQAGQERRFSVVEGGKRLRGGEGQAQLSIVESTANRLALDVDAPEEGLVVVSQAWHPDWRAYLDGEAARLWKADGVVSGVYTPAGEHQIVLVYEPRLTYLGAGISMIGLALSLAWLLKPRMRFHSGDSLESQA